MNGSFTKILILRDGFFLVKNFMTNNEKEKIED